MSLRRSLLLSLAGVSTLLVDAQSTSAIAAAASTKKGTCKPKTSSSSSCPVCTPINTCSISISTSTLTVYPTTLASSVDLDSSALANTQASACDASTITITSPSIIISTVSADPSVSEILTDTVDLVSTETLTVFQNLTLIENSISTVVQTLYVSDNFTVTQNALSTVVQTVDFTQAPVTQTQTIYVSNNFTITQNSIFTTVQNIDITEPPVTQTLNIYNNVTVTQVTTAIATITDITTVTVNDTVTYTLQSMSGSTTDQESAASTLISIGATSTSADSSAASPSPTCPGANLVGSGGSLINGTLAGGVNNPLSWANESSSAPELYFELTGSGVLYLVGSGLPGLYLGNSASNLYLGEVNSNSVTLLQCSLSTSETLNCSSSGSAVTFAIYEFANSGPQAIVNYKGYRQSGESVAVSYVPCPSTATATASAPTATASGTTCGSTAFYLQIATGSAGVGNQLTYLNSDGVILTYWGHSAQAFQFAYPYANTTTGSGQLIAQGSSQLLNYAYVPGNDYGQLTVGRTGPLGSSYSPLDCTLDSTGLTCEAYNSNTMAFQVLNFATDSQYGEFAYAYFGDLSNAQSGSVEVGVVAVPITSGSC